MRPNSKYTHRVKIPGSFGLTAISGEACGAGSSATVQPGAVSRGYCPRCPLEEIVVPLGGDDPGLERDCCERKKKGIEGGKDGSPLHGRNYSRAEFVKRVCAIDVMECPGCGGCMRILCAVNPSVFA